MEQRMSLITLGVADLQRAAAFYEGVVGWQAAASPPGLSFLICTASCSPSGRILS
jgi:predicted enzyme related to lactoylglutathione lyase